MVRMKQQKDRMKEEEMNSEKCTCDEEPTSSTAGKDAKRLPPFLVDRLLPFFFYFHNIFFTYHFFFFFLLARFAHGSQLFIYSGCTQPTCSWYRIKHTFIVGFSLLLHIAFICFAWSMCFSMQCMSKGSKNGEVYVW